MNTRVTGRFWELHGAARAAWLGLCSVWLLGCSDDGAALSRTDPEAGQEEFFDSTRRIEVEVELAPADWEALREEGRSVTSLLMLGEYEYTYFDASVTIDGVRYEHVQARKKGFLGSLSAVRPSIKVDLDRVVKDQNHVGLHSVTLNNDRQDPSHTHQCMAYRMFQRAGLPASRCNLAHVVVNGEDLGTYSNVEAISKQFLRHHFGNDTGNLYEGQAADFAPFMVERLQLKTNEKENDRSDTLALTAALDADDEHLVESLSEQLDLDQFRDFWAMEVLLGHWDSYSGNTNNYFVYREPVSQRFVFLPWGVDGAFEGANPFDALNHDITVYAAGRIANRLYNLPSERERYRKRLGELNDRLWKADTMLAEVDQVEALAPDASQQRLSAQRMHIESHSDLLRAALAEPAQDWQQSSGEAPGECFGVMSDVSGHFDTTFGSLEDLQPGNNELKLTLDGKEVEFPWVVRAGVAVDDPNPRIRYVALLEDQRLLIADFSIPPSRFSPGHRRFHGVETSGTLLIVGDSGFNFVGLIGDGAIDLDEASTAPDAAVAGSVTGRLLQLGCADL